MARNFDWTEMVSAKFENKEVAAMQNSAGASNIKIEMVSVYDIDPHEKNRFEMSDIESLADALEDRGGLESPILVVRQENGRFKAITGHRRRLAIIHLLERKSKIITSPLVPVIIKSYADADKELESIIFDNILQRRLPKRARGNAFAELEPIAKKKYALARKEGYRGAFRKYFAEEYLHISEPMLQRCLALTKIAPEIAEKIEDGYISETAVSLISAYDYAEQLKIIGEIEKETSGNGNEKKITVKVIQDYIKKSKQPEPAPVQVTEEKQPEPAPAQVTEEKQAESVPAQVSEEKQAEPVPAQVAEEKQPEPAPAQVVENESIEDYTKLSVQGKISGIGVPQIVEEKQAEPAPAQVADIPPKISPLKKCLESYNKLTPEEKEKLKRQHPMKNGITLIGLNYMRDLLKRKIEIFSMNTDDISIARVGTMKIFQQEILRKIDEFK